MAVAPPRHRVTMLVPPSAETLTAALEGLTAVDFVQLSRERGMPLLYEAGIVYRREKRTENWRTVEDVIRDGFGDCEDLAAWRAAELRLDGELARAVVVRAKPDPEKPRRTQWHAVVQRADGELEDPSKVLIWLERKRRARRAPSRTR